MQVKLHSKFNLLSWGVIILFLFTTPVWADLYFEMTDTDYSSTPGGETTEVDHEKGYIKSDRMKIDDLTNKKTTIVRLDKELVWEIDHNEKTYTQISFAELEEKISREMSRPPVSPEQMAQMEEMMKSMPPEQRQMMEQSMEMARGAQTAFTEPPEVIQTGKKKKILGYTCELVKVSFGKIMTWEMWVSKEIASDIDFSKFSLGLGMPKPMAEGFSKIKGFPLKTVQESKMTGTYHKSTSEATKLKTKKISDKEFELPKGYKKVAVSDSH